MPTFVVNTNLPKDKIPPDFLQQTSAFLAKQLEKPEFYVVVRVNPDQMMITAGTNEPCAIVELHNITDGAKNKENAEAITNFIESTLAIPKSRFYVIFTNLRREDIAFQGKTFA
ncbi:macrophage migration inhibitory factor-like [Crassostrea virginica]|uniref:L-dopachrome isomerase n=1 Tax=Crassostrea virginica TaxID=6565 RepID=A0A8B8ECK1_CRAVI|nr:macrophage migration inhibitory factor-like [Crassostrea virginica]XP_022337850.1 macrophage migration inhibitory factor-like [Crassostrea virginica]